MTILIKNVRGAVVEHEDPDSGLAVLGARLGPTFLQRGDKLCLMVESWIDPDLQPTSVVSGEQ